MPPFLVVSSVGFLLVTIVQSWKRNYLFKTSLLPTLLLGPGDGVREGGVVLLERGRVMGEDLMKSHGKVKMRLEKDGKEVLKLKRE